MAPWGAMLCPCFLVHGGRIAEHDLGFVGLPQTTHQGDTGGRVRSRQWPALSRKMVNCWSCCSTDTNAYNKGRSRELNRLTTDVTDTPVHGTDYKVHILHQRHILKTFTCMLLRNSSCWCELTWSPPLKHGTLFKWKMEHLTNVPLLLQTGKG